MIGVVLRTVGDQPTLWESLLPAEALVMPAELAAVDAVLDDARFFEPYRRFFHARWGGRRSRSRRTCG